MACNDGNNPKSTYFMVIAIIVVAAIDCVTSDGELFW
jgi:hypothetical protein